MTPDGVRTVIIYLGMNEYSNELVQKYEKGRASYSDTDANLMALVERAGVVGRDALDLGSGDGRYAAMLLDMGAGKVKGIDISPAMVRKAQVKYKNIDFVLGDGLEMPFESESFDVVFSNHVLHYFKDINGIFAEIARVLKKGGHFVGVFNTVETNSDEVLNAQMPLFLGEGDEKIKIYNLAKLQGEYEEAMASYGLKIAERIVVKNPCAIIDSNFKYYKDIKKLNSVTYLLKR